MAKGVLRRRKWPTRVATFLDWGIPRETRCLSLPSFEIPRVAGKPTPMDLLEAEKPFDLAETQDSYLDRTESSCPGIRHAMSRTGCPEAKSAVSRQRLLQASQ